MGEKIFLLFSFLPLVAVVCVCVCHLILTGQARSKAAHFTLQHNERLLIRLIDSLTSAGAL